MFNKMNDFDKDLSDSAFDFKRLIYPKLKELNFISGELVQIEVATDIKFKYLASKFDQLSGIDAWQIVEPLGIKGIASRIQWGEKAWGTFTIRKTRATGTKTEYEKRVEAIESGEWLYPYYTIQGYITERRVGKLLSFAIAKTEDIFEMIDKGFYKENKNKEDSNIFIIVNWIDMKKQGYRIKIYPK